MKLPTASQKRCTGLPLTGSVEAFYSNWQQLR
jgi:hypothetical protein